MAQFDVHRNTGAHKGVIPYVVIVQSQRLDASFRRVVIPLVDLAVVPTTEPTLNPTFTVEGRPVVLHPLQIVSMPADRMGDRVSSLEPEADRILAAIDLLVSRAWG